MTLFLFWVAVAIVTGLAAQSRGRSFMAWFALGFLFSFLALIAVLVMNRVETADDVDRTSQAIASKHGISKFYRKCPACAEVVRREAKKCKHCQSELEPVTD
ncbi:hypothetical protein SAMN05216201_107102 [Pseudomonas linyingensis]|uniref:Putative zinc-ribbon domain-containing protein n=1 Tax=Pseudomonas linyingensis TaxID=915471 RepID=A0A1H6Y9R0_9PSED|nr:hypothetical protein [Pseudomonas linyingensis]SEJ33932.1 hypothetical protein SAMN05216201_107102 [Pseudomonas linyingensis]